MVSAYAIMYNLSLNVFRDIMKENKAWQEVAEIVGSSDECANTLNMCC